MMCPAILANKVSRVHMALAMLLALWQLSGCAGSFHGITIGGSRVQVLRSDVILECQSGSAPFACRELTTGEQERKEVKRVQSTHAASSVIQIPDGIALLLQGIKVVVKMNDETVISGTIGEGSTAESLAVVAHNGDIALVKWSAVASVTRDPGKENPYD